jgi:hypothetical protein
MDPATERVLQDLEEALKESEAVLVEARRRRLAIEERLRRA